MERVTLVLDTEDGKKTKTVSACHAQPYIDRGYRLATDIKPADPTPAPVAPAPAPVAPVVPPVSPAKSKRKKG